MPKTANAAEMPDCHDSAQEMVELVIIGHIGTEAIHTPMGDAVTLGGAGYHSLVGAFRSGASTGIVSCVGTEYPVTEIASLEVDTTGLLIIDGLSPHFDIRYTPTFSDRSVSLDLGVGASLDIVDFPECYRSAKYIHIATNLPNTQLALVRALRLITDATLTVDCFDEFIAQEPSTVLQVLQACDLYFANEDEQRLIEQLQPIDTVHIVKRGPRGADFYDGGRLRFRVPAPAARVVDPTGAGDVFAGAFLGSRSRGLDVPSAMEFACRLAAISVEGFGSSLLAGSTRRGTYNR